MLPLDSTTRLHPRARIRITSKSYQTQIRGGREFAVRENCSWLASRYIINPVNGRYEARGQSAEYNIVSVTYYPYKSRGESCFTTTTVALTVPHARPIKPRIFAPAYPSLGRARTARIQFSSGRGGRESGESTSVYAFPFLSIVTCSPTTMRSVNAIYRAYRAATLLAVIFGSRRHF